MAITFFALTLAFGALLPVLHRGDRQYVARRTARSRQNRTLAAFVRTAIDAEQQNKVIRWMRL